MHLVRWAFSGGKTDFRREPTKKKRNKNNSVLEEARGFFIQCARPMVHAGRSILRSWHRVAEEWEDCRLWWNDPIYRSGQPHYRRPQIPSYELLPLEGVSSHLQRSATTPFSLSSFSMQSPKRPTAVASPQSDTTPSTPLPSSSRFASPQPVAGGHSFFDEPAPVRNTVQRHTFERTATGQ